MKTTVFLQEPSLHRMLVRFVFVVGLLLLAAQIAVLLHLNSILALVGLSAVPALGVSIVESILEARVRRQRKADQSARDVESERQNLRYEITQAMVLQRSVESSVNATQEVLQRTMGIIFELRSMQEAIQRIESNVEALEVSKNPHLSPVEEVRESLALVAQALEVLKNWAVPQRLEGLNKLTLDLTAASDTVRTAVAMLRNQLLQIEQAEKEEAEKERKQRA